MSPHPSSVSPALARIKQGFDSPWAYQSFQRLSDFPVNIVEYPSNKLRRTMVNATVDFRGGSCRYRQIRATWNSLTPIPALSRLLLN
jgi:hypothetical protein